MMHRNLDRRVEALVQLTSGDDTTYVMDLLRRYMDPGTASWHLDNQAVWTRHHVTEDGQELEDIQSWLLNSRSRQRSSGLR
jgi:polyphosphate kinase